MATTLATWTIDPVHLSVEFSPDALRPPQRLVVGTSV